MDILATHKVARVRDSIDATGAQRLYLPPYSPDFNPIEMVFAKLKASLRCAAERSIQALWKNIGSLLHSFSPSECSRYFPHARYVST